MKLTTEKPTTAYFRRGGKAKYQFIYDKICEITKEKAIVITCDKKENPRGLRTTINSYLNRIGLRGKYAILLRDGNKLYIQFKTNF